MVDLKENAQHLHDTIAHLGNAAEDGLFSKKSAFSSDESIASVSCIGTPDPDAASTFQLKVLNLASPQENMGTFLANAPVGLPAGIYSFDVDINDTNYEFQFAVNEGENNQDMQNRLVRLINNADIGLQASILVDDNLSALRLTSKATGLPAEKSNIFHISDKHTSKQKGAVEYLGLDYVSREPGNACFLVNGKEHSSASNLFTLGKFFEVQLNNVSPEGTSVQIGLKTDLESLKDNVLHLVNGYNDFINAASSHMETQHRSRQLVREFGHIAAHYSPALETIGITLTEDGTLEANEDTLQRSVLESKNLAETFGSLKPFSSALLKKSGQVSLDPMEYVDKIMVAYKNPGHNFASPYITSAYSGMLFNGYC